MKKSGILILLFACIISRQGVAQTITTFAGNGFKAGTGLGGFTGDGGSATLAELYRPYSVATDIKGNVYLSDNYNNVIRKVNTAGIILTIAGSGTIGFSGDGGAATLAQLSIKQGGRIATDLNGNVYISDNGNNRIRKVSTLGIINTIVGTGAIGFSGDGGQATVAQLTNPCGITCDAIGNLYISDPSNGVIRKVSTNGIITTVAGSHLPPGSGFSGDGGQATLAFFNTPVDVAIDLEGNLYIADNYNNRIRKVNTLGIISTYAGNGTATSEINDPIAIAIDNANNIYYTNGGRATISKINTFGIITTYAGGGNCGSIYCGDGGQATSAQIASPFGIATDIIGNLYIADSYDNVIRKVALPDSIVAAHIIIPNIFTPNNDSVNDTFFVKGANLSNFSCAIFNRWGNELYKWSDITTGWNGKDKNGTTYDDGTYYYVVTYTDNTGKAQMQKGFVQLVR